MKNQDANISLGIDYRPATLSDVTAIVQMFADDPLGAQREDAASAFSQPYINAFQAIDTDPNNELIVAVCGDDVVGVFQITYIPYLTHKGAWRALIEGVRVHRKCRGRGIGKAMIEWAINKAHEKACKCVQLTTDKSRGDTIRFYEELGFQASHEGFKLWF
ncbi:MAG: GNAT family N-acetyltransferase [Gammaproteobacteria bacterium]|nr:GNAT family N-acetyltransferase [Gammaproteobacteria bacterium]MDH3466739.1 GNAT family N-acetyltransferase [Gammaproteobacteria bacterium]